MKKIVLFTLYDCIYCVSLKHRLIDLSIEFTEIEINENPEIWEAVVNEIKHELLPTVLIFTIKDEAIIYIPSIDYQTEDEIVDIIVNWGK